MREQMPMYLLALALGQRSWGLPAVLVARQGQPCELCACNCFRVFIGIGGQDALGIWHLASSPHLWPSESYLIHFIRFFFFPVSIKVGFLDYNSEPCMVYKAKLNGGKIALGNSLSHITYNSKSVVWHVRMLKRHVSWQRHSFKHQVPLYCVLRVSEALKPPPFRAQLCLSLLLSLSACAHEW